jgi:alkylation response protein AidB-like acyl-CoA dehydrogenase
MPPGRLGQLVVTDAPLTPDALLPDVSGDDVRDLALVLAAAEGAGVARWCLDTASEYAKVRVQFGRPIGQFQAIKHALADMLVAVEQCAAVAWDAAAAWSGDADAPTSAR